jgi:hypothetical protein
MQLSPQCTDLLSCLLLCHLLSVVRAACVAQLAFLREQWAHIDEVVRTGSLEPVCNTGCEQKLDCVVLKC